MTPHDREKLKPCPFCGKELINESISFWDGLYAVNCWWNCGIQGPKADTKEKAIALWNNRGGG